ncbi:MAG TPA: hypothetical protein VGA77_09825 [Propylenella sp.]
MSELCLQEIEETIRAAIANGDTILVAFAAKTIALKCGGSPELIAEALTKAGIKAGATMKFGTIH